MRSPWSSPLGGFAWIGSQTSLSGSGCGVKVEILRWHIGDPLPYTVVATLPAGFDVAFRTATFNDGSNDDVLFDRLRCAGHFYSDVYEVPAANTA
jgi:hypothetical protein